MCTMGGGDDDQAQVWMEKKTTDCRRGRACMICDAPIAPGAERIYHHSRSYYGMSKLDRQRRKREGYILVRSGEQIRAIERSITLVVGRRTMSRTDGHICMACEKDRDSFADSHGLIPNPTMFTDNLYECIFEEAEKPEIDPTPKEIEAYRQAKEESREWRDALAGIKRRARAAHRARKAA